VTTQHPWRLRLVCLRLAVARSESLRAVT
jgi:hypothetical protein